jgi:FkbM family methyltransferase
MTQRLRSLLDWFMSTSHLEFLPVRVRTGIAAGARWTAYPWSGYWRGGHEPELQDALLRLGNWTGKSCWDLGAHFGIYSIGLARATGPTGQVAAFEPNPMSYRRLEYHRRLNRLEWLQIFPSAVSDRAGTGELYTYGSLHGTTVHLPYDGETASPETHPLAVSTVVLDDLVRHRQLQAPDFIKVDVEGHAHRALAGARATLVAHRPILVVAFHSPEEIAGVLALLDPLGYRREIIGPPGASASELSGRDVLFQPR